jgi:hypothetical protein
MRGRSWIVLVVAIVIAGGAGLWLSRPVQSPASVAIFPVRPARKTTPAELKISLGRVAQAATATNIYSSPNESSHRYYKVRKGDYLVVKEDSAHPEWQRVLLQNRQYGYAPAASLTVLNYEYKVPAKAARPASMSFGQTTAWEAQNYSGPHLTGAAFVKEVYGRAGGKDLPASYDAQIGVGTPVKRLEDLRAGDRVYFWNDKEERVNDAGIYVGKGYFARLSSKGVENLYLGDKRWMKALVAARS